jgi:hypothetical protein
LPADIGTVLGRDMSLLDRLFGGRKNKRLASPPKLTPEEADRLILQQLTALGADLTKPRQQRHYLYFPSEELAARARERLESDGFTVQLHQTDRDWCALASCTGVVNKDIVDDARIRLTKLATSFSGKYDGWEASPNP